MLDDKMLDLMKPSIFIEYRIEPNILTPGTMESVPENAVGAYIYQSFPVVGTDGNISWGGHAYNLYVGHRINVYEYLKAIIDNTIKKKLTELATSGNEYAVIPEYSKEVNSANQMVILPLGPLDKVYSSKQEFVEAISKINSTYNSINISIQNSSQEIEKSFSKKL